MNTMSTAIDKAQLITAPEVDSATRMSRATRYRTMRDDPSFPKPLRQNPASPRSRLKFRLVEVLAWIEQKQAQTTAAQEEGAGSLDIHLAR
jgi:prophage regulatory protein